jgi:hypothetical protein
MNVQDATSPLIINAIFDRERIASAIVRTAGNLWFGTNQRLRDNLVCATQYSLAYRHVFMAQIAASAHTGLCHAFVQTEILPTAPMLS